MGDKLKVVPTCRITASRRRKCSFRRRIIGKFLPPGRRGVRRGNMKLARTGR
ncbi:hypothetical protein KCP70_09230 [Salmonella enterica subsp. enterica]|nr:hypothetical protein KCP70_09230 [Salmonella enterica subsp. enterica]